MRSTVRNADLCNVHPAYLILNTLGAHDTTQFWSFLNDKRYVRQCVCVCVCVSSQISREMAMTVCGRLRCLTAGRLVLSTLAARLHDTSSLSSSCCRCQHTGLIRRHSSFSFETFKHNSCPTMLYLFITQ